MQVVLFAFSVDLMHAGVEFAFDEHDVPDLISSSVLFPNNHSGINSLKLFTHSAKLEILESY